MIARPGVNKEGAHPASGGEADYRQRWKAAVDRIEELMRGAPLDPRTAVDGKIPSGEEFVRNLAWWMVMNRIPEKVDEIRRAYGLPSPKPYRSKKP